MRPYPLDARLHNVNHKPVLLTDQQVADFIASGYLKLNSSLPQSFHQSIFEQFDELSQGIGHFGNNLLPLVPELNELFEDPVVKGALQSLLGKDYVMHPHRALHSNPPGSDEQGFHKDSYWGYVRRVRNHRPWWVMIMYFPQDTPEDKGPTQVLSGSHHLNERPHDYCEPVSISGKAGDFVLIHYDIWHRKMLNQTDMNRYMFKFEFVRLTPPTVTDRGDWPGTSLHVKPNLEPVWRSVWSWINGQSGESKPHGTKAPDKFTDLDCNQEWQGILASYEHFTHIKEGNLDHLCQALDSNPSDYNEERRYSDNGTLWKDDVIARNASHALVNIGTPAVPGLIKTLESRGARAQKHAAFALGEIGDSRAESALMNALHHEEVHVRVAAIEAIGLLSPTPKTVQGMILALQDTASEVRFDAALSLTRAAAHDVPTSLLIDAIDPLGEALYDTNRYVCGYAVEALERIGSTEAMAHLLPFLRTARWCSHTDNKRPF